MALETISHRGSYLRSMYKITLYLSSDTRQRHKTGTGVVSVPILIC